MASTFTVITRQISISSTCYGKRNFRMIQLYNKRGSRMFKEERAKNPHYDIPIDSTYIFIYNIFHNISLTYF